MALIKSLASRFGATFPNAYHRISAVNCSRMKFSGENGPYYAPGAVITTAVYADADAAAGGVDLGGEVCPVDSITVTVPLTGEIAGGLIAQAYTLLKTTPEYLDAVDA